MSLYIGTAQPPVHPHYMYTHPLVGRLKEKREREKRRTEVIRRAESRKGNGGRLPPER